MTKKEYDRRRYSDNKEFFKARTRTNRAKARQVALSHYGLGGNAVCCRCGIDDMDVLTLDHVGNDGNNHRQSDKNALAIVLWVVRNGLPDGFQTLCWNCNYKKYREYQRSRMAAKRRSLVQQK